jgi:hypothetical protein
VPGRTDALLYCSTNGFKNLSDYQNRISKLKYDAKNGDQHWQYTRKNMAGIGGIAIDETCGTNLKSPQTWIKVQWKDIKKEHQGLLVRQCDWTPRSDVIRLMGRKVASTVIHAAWDMQETRHLEAIKSEGGPDGRSPSPFPLAIFEAEKFKREESRTPDRCESTSAPLKTLSSIPKSRPRANSIKQEQGEETNNFLPPRSSIENAPASNVTEIERSGGSQTKNQAPKTFNIQTYIASVEKMEKWNAISEAEREKRYRKALANYDHYKEERESKGDVEVDEEL